MAGDARAAQPPYYFLKGLGFEIYSSRAWHGTSGTAGVREVAPYTNITPRDSDRSYSIWTPSCKPGQKFSVARSVDLLGKPSQVRFSFAMTMSVASTALLVNGKAAGKGIGNSSPPDLTPAKLALFREGMNTITVVVTLQNAKTACGSGKPSVWFEISGSFASDLTVGAPQPNAKVEYFKADGGKTVTTNIRVINMGPDLIPEASITIQMSGTGFCVKRKPDNSCDPGDTQFAMLGGSESFGGTIKCAVDRFLIATCPVDNLKPGETRIVTVIVRFQLDPTEPGWTEESTSLTWIARIADGGPSDTNTGNDSAQIGYVFCSTRSTMAGCTSATK